MTTVSTLSTLSPAPTREMTETDFTAASELFLPGLNTLQTEFNTSVGQINTVAGEINSDKLDAAQSVVDAAAQVDLAEAQVTLATTQANISTAAAAAAIITANTTVYAAETTYAAGNTVYDPNDNYTVYTSQQNGNTGHAPSSDDGTWWKKTINTAPTITRVDRTSNTILSAANNGNFINIISGTFTQTFSACAGLGDGWFCYIKNAGTGDITLDPDGAETVDGLSSYIMYPGEARLIQCDGSILTSIVISPFEKEIFTSMTFTTPPGYNFFHGKLWGAGASGGKGGAGYSTGGGGGGAEKDFIIPTSDMGSSQSIVIGAGGSYVSSFGNGLAGGNSSIGSLVTAYGGGAGGGSETANRIGGSGAGSFSVGSTGTAGVTAVVGGLPYIGDPSSGTTTFVNQTHGGGWSYNVGGSSIFGGGAGGGEGVAGNSQYGGAGGGGINSSNGIPAAGTSEFGGDGGIAGLAVSGADGTCPGGGGGATHTGAESGAGGDGKCIISGGI